MSVVKKIAPIDDELYGVLLDELDVPIWDLSDESVSINNGKSVRTLERRNFISSYALRYSGVCYKLA
jgi:hypothetical protein